MKPAIELPNATIYLGSNLDVLPTLADNSIDAIVTDPPYELGFMGKTWDSSGIAYSVEMWQQCLRILKPGGYLLAFGGSRTWHRLAVAIEDAGYDIRDSIAWIYGSGFPKSLNISKALQKLDNDNAANWQGWGTALKPAFEPIVVARKPIQGTVANNVLQWGVGGINIDASRIPYRDAADLAAYEFNKNGTTRTTKTEGEALGLHQGGWKVQKEERETPVGRFPANLILDEYTAELLDEQAPTTGAFAQVKSGHSGKSSGIYGDYAQRGDDGATFYNDGLGGASRFFYVAKASKRDRNEGLEELPLVKAGSMAGGEDLREGKPTNHPERQNFHPTVKPTDLMRYLVKLVTPQGGTILDPFTGSGSTGKAAILEGYNFTGIELTEEYLPIIQGRLDHAQRQRQETLI